MPDIHGTREELVSLLVQTTREREDWNGKHQAACIEIERLRAALEEIVAADTHSGPNFTGVGMIGRIAKRGLGIYEQKVKETP